MFHFEIEHFKPHMGDSGLSDGSFMCVEGEYADMVRWIYTGNRSGTSRLSGKVIDEDDSQNRGEYGNGLEIENVQ